VRNRSELSELSVVTELSDAMSEKMVYLNVIIEVSAM